MYQDTAFILFLEKSLFASIWKHILTGKSFSVALILASTNLQYDKRFFIELQVQYIKITSSEDVVYTNCSECQNKKQFMYTKCSEL